MHGSKGSQSKIENRGAKQNKGDGEGLELVHGSKGSQSKIEKTAAQNQNKGDGEGLELVRGTKGSQSKIKETAINTGNSVVPKDSKRTGTSILRPKNASTAGTASRSKRRQHRNTLRGREAFQRRRQFSDKTSPERESKNDQ